MNYVQQVITHLESQSDDFKRKLGLADRRLEITQLIVDLLQVDDRPAEACQVITWVAMGERRWE